MKEDLVSVVIPAYNTGKYIANIIEAVKSQTYENLEIVIVDDGSKDNTVEIAGQLLKDYDKPWQIIKSKNGGVSSARNIGIKVSKGDWVICPDSDDYIDPQMIEILYKAAVQNDAQCAFCEYKSSTIEFITGRTLYNKGISVFGRDEIKQIYLSRSIIWVIPATLIHRSIIENIEYDVDCPYSEDTLYTWELIYQIEKIAFVAADMYNYFQRENSKQHSLIPSKCLKAIEQYQKMVYRLLVNNQGDKKFINNIVPKFILGAFHVLARCTTYDVFKDTRRQIEINRVYPLLFIDKNTKLFIYAFSFVFTPYVFYRVSKLN